MDTTTAGWTAPPGLEGVVVAETRIGSVRGEEGFYHYGPHPAPALAERCTTEEVWHLLHRGHLPDSDELDRFAATTGRLRALPDDVASALGPIAAIGGSQSLAGPRTALSLLAAAEGFGPWLDLSSDVIHHQAVRLVAVLPTLTASLWRLGQGEDPIAPTPDRPLAEDYLRMVTGSEPLPQHVRALERYLVLTIDHGFNASTFTARTVTSTGADLGSAVVAAMGALSGPLHGGAPSLALDMLQQIGRPDRAAAWVDEALAGGRRIMGFGHRVYRTEDPRSALLKQTAIELGGPIVDLAIEVEGTILEALQRHRPGRELRTNVEYYAGVVLHLVGLPEELFTPTFAISRNIGWTAHAIEQMEANRLIRPRARYVGPPPD